MARLAILSVLIVGLLAGCGQVVVFGHVVGDRPISAEPRPEASAPTGTVTPSAPQSGTQAPASATPPASEPSMPASSQPTAAATAPVARIVSAVSLIVTPEAAAKVAGDASRFTQDALLDAIKAELKSRKLLDEQNPSAAGTAEIVVDSLATRATTNAIVFGYKMLAGTLEGDIRVTGVQGGQSTGSRIVAQSKLTVAINGNDKNPFGPLYHRFAVLAADRLAGVASTPQPTGPVRY